MSTGLRLKFNGEEFDVPSLASLTLKEAALINRVCDVSAREFALHAEKADELYVAGLLAVGLRRAHPDWRTDVIEQLINDAALDSFSVLLPDVPAEPTVPLADENDGSSGSSDSTDNPPASEES